MAKLDRECNDNALCRLDGYKSTEGLPRSYFIHRPVMAGRPDTSDNDVDPNPFTRVCPQSEQVVSDYNGEQIAESLSRGVNYE